MYMHANNTAYLCVDKVHALYSYDIRSRKLMLPVV